MEFLLGFIVGSFIFEPLIINFVYFTNIGLFLDIILSEKNRYKLEKYFQDRVALSENKKRM